MRAFLGLTFLALLLPALAPAARGGGFDFLWSVNLAADDRQLFLHLAVGDAGVDRKLLEPQLPRIRKLETELPAILLLARESRRPLAEIVDLRAGGLSWPAIFGKLGVSFDVLFGGIDRDPGPPYGNAWGYWKKHPRELRLSDAEIGGLVEIQIGQRASGLSAFDLARARGRGRSVVGLVADKKGRPYQAKGRKEKPEKEKPEKGKGEKGKGKGQVKEKHH